MVDAPPALELVDFGVAFGDRVVLSRVSFSLPARGITILAGPAGGGKSTLLRTLAGSNDAHPSLSTWGTVRTASHGRPALVVQHARFYLDSVFENIASALPERSMLERRQQLGVVRAHLEEVGLGSLVPDLDARAVDLPLAAQRRLAIARALISAPSILFADEPTFGLDDEDATPIVEMLQREGERRAVLLVTHNQRLAKLAGGITVLLIGGKVHEVTPSTDFFETPRTEVGQHFVRTGGYSPPSEDAPRARPSSRPPPAAASGRSRFVGPRGFFWVVPDRLGGVPRPGIVEDLATDLDGLQRLGIALLVTLEETAVIDAGELTQRGIDSIHFPIVDMGVPNLDAAHTLCAEIERRIDLGQAVAVHCRAGLGRTGTMLACQLVWQGASAAAAIDTVRTINPRCIQSEAQVAFVQSFGGSLETRTADSNG